MHAGCRGNARCPQTVLGLHRAGFSKGGDLDEEADSALCLCTFVAPAFSDLFPFRLRFQNRVPVSRATRRATKQSNCNSPIQRSLCGDRRGAKRDTEKKGMNGSSISHAVALRKHGHNCPRKEYGLNKPAMPQEPGWMCFYEYSCRDLSLCSSVCVFLM